LTIREGKGESQISDLYFMRRSFPSIKLLLGVIRDAFY
jgi:hypothetical protein